MVTAYVTTDAASSDPRVIITRMMLTTADSPEPVTTPVAPGTCLVLDLAIQATVDLPNAGLALLFHRADGLLVFDGSSMLDGEPPFNLVAGRVWHIRVTFRANLLRGTYAISGHLFEERRHWSAAQLGVLGSFVVAETTRWGGVAELEPRYLTCNRVDL
jgi:hypothetical protein